MEEAWEMPENMGGNNVLQEGACLFSVGDQVMLPRSGG